MNTEMWNHPRTQEHVKDLRLLTNLGLINPAAGLLACGDVGAGKFPEVSAVVDLIESYSPLQNNKKKIVITAGATAAPMDPVRYLTNPSSGRMGLAVAKAFLSAGYEVTVLAGHQCLEAIHNLDGHPCFKLIYTPTTQSMKEAALINFPQAALYVSTGAIADIEFEPSASKLKKETMGSSINFHQAADILKEVLSLKKPDQKIVSFAAETETTEAVFREKMLRKPVDLMIGNKVSSGLMNGESLIGFQNENSSFHIVTPQKTIGPVALTKKELGIKLVQWFEGAVQW